MSNASQALIRTEHAEVAAELLTAARQRLAYDADSGQLTILKGRSKGPITRLNAGGYLTVCLLGKKRQAHRIAWLMHYGRLPAGDLDHIDRDRTNNRISNLREVSREENARNRGPWRSNSSGYKGVSFHQNTGRFCAEIMVSKRRINLGVFAEARQAALAYDEAAIRYHGEKACTNAMLGLLPHLEARAA